MTRRWEDPECVELRAIFVGAGCALSEIISLHIPTHSLQMYTVSPAMIVATSSCALPQKEHLILFTSSGISGMPSRSSHAGPNAVLNVDSNSSTVIMRSEMRSALFMDCRVPIVSSNPFLIISRASLYRSSEIAFLDSKMNLS